LQDFEVTRGIKALRGGSKQRGFTFGIMGFDESIPALSFPSRFFRKWFLNVDSRPAEFSRKEE